MSKECDIIRYIYQLNSDSSTQDQENCLRLTKNIIDLQDSSKKSVNKQPKLIFEKIEKQPKNKVYNNEFILNVAINKDKMIKSTLHSNL